MRQGSHRYLIASYKLPESYRILILLHDAPPSRHPSWAFVATGRGSCWNTGNMRPSPHADGVSRTVRRTDVARAQYDARSDRLQLRGSSAERRHPGQVARSHQPIPYQEVIRRDFWRAFLEGVANDDIDVRGGLGGGGKLQVFELKACQLRLDQLGHPKVGQAAPAIERPEVAGQDQSRGRGMGSPRTGDAQCGVRKRANLAQVGGVSGPSLQHDLSPGAPALDQRVRPAQVGGRDDPEPFRQRRAQRAGVD